MNDELVIIDAGHGGLDSGAVSGNLQEKDLTLKAATYIYERLQELGIPSILVREDDEYLPKDKRVERINEIVRNNPNSILISNHINAGGGEGAEVVYSLKNNSDFAELILDKIGEKGQVKRKAYQRRLPENPSKDYYYILRETNTKEPVLIEYGFIDNPKNSYKLQRYLDDYAEAVVESIAEYLGYPYMDINDNIEEYIVKKGDTLYSISRKFNIPLEELKRINNLTTNTLIIGQVLKLKEVGQLDNNIYIVESGDTLWSIARTFNITVDMLVKANNLSSNILSVGQELIIPDKKETIPPVTPPEDDISPDEYMIYTVEKGDSLWLISQKYSITVPKLIEINNLEDLTIYIGQKLLVPKKEESNEYYIVKSGDTLWSIANKNNISVEELKSKNNLTSNLLSIGQQLLI